VVEASKDNPVFYVQYAHARIARCSARRRRRGIDLPAPPTSLLDEEELALVKLAAQFPRVVEARRRRTSRTASPSTSTISPPRSTRCGTRATTIPRGVSYWHTIPS
jgi:hypothetical protein